MHLPCKRISVVHTGISVCGRVYRHGSGTKPPQRQISAARVYHSSCLLDKRPQMCLDRVDPDLKFIDKNQRRYTVCTLLRFQQPQLDQRIGAVPREPTGEYRVVSRATRMTQLNEARSSTSSEKGMSGRGFESAPIRTGDVKPRWYGRAEEANSRKHKIKGQLRIVKTAYPLWWDAPSLWQGDTSAKPVSQVLVLKADKHGGIWVA